VPEAVRPDWGGQSIATLDSPEDAWLKSSSVVGLSNVIREAFGPACDVHLVFFTLGHAFRQRQELRRPRKRPPPLKGTYQLSEVGQEIRFSE
jgi:hypothetical protein